MCTYQRSHSWTTACVHAEEQLAKLKQDIRAQGTWESKASHMKTWAYLHERWFGPGIPVLPLTVTSIFGVAAQMKDSKYRRFSNYMDTMVAEHSANFDWDRSLDLARKQCCRSTTRGIGPARQCHEIPIHVIYALNLSMEPLHPNGPVCPAQWATLSIFHILRRAESACALASNMVIYYEACEESWHLPISKTAPTGVGCT